MNDPLKNHEPMEEAAAAFALGILEGDDLRAFEAHRASGCPQCEALIAEFGSVTDALPLAVGMVAPPAGLKARILNAAGVTGRGSSTAPAGSWADGTGAADVRPREFDYEKMRKPRPQSFWMPLAYAALAGLAIVSFRVIQLNNRIQESARAAEEKNQQIASLESEITSLRATAEQQAALVRLLNQPESGLVTLASLAPAPGASGKVLWDRREGKGYLWVSNLPADPQGKDYQLWAIADGKPVSAGVFSAENGSALIPLESLPGEGVAAFAITLEPEGGVPAPSGDMVLLGNVSG
jgi:anti-sigma-K factor RskA